MATQTTNYGLIKPDPSDFADIADFNENMDTIDGTLENKANVAYCICETASDKGVKIATVVTGIFDELTVGAAVDVRFVHTNVSITPMLNVNGTGERFIKLYGITAAKENQWAAGSIIRFVYNGTFWIMQNGTLASENSYGMTKLSSSTDSEDKGSAATPSAVKAAYDRASTAITDAAAAQTTADAAKTAAEAAQASADKASKQFYGICNSESSTAEKEVVILANDDPNDPDKLDESFELKDGVSVDVWFKSYNSASAPTMNVNGTGAKDIGITSIAAPPVRLWKAKSVVRFVYDKDSNTWIIPNTAIASTTFYGLTKLCNNLNTNDDSLAASANTVYQLNYLLGMTNDDLVENYLPKTGGTLSGNLRIEKSTYPNINLKSTSSGAFGITQIGTNNIQMLVSDSEDVMNTDHRALVMHNTASKSDITDALQFQNWVGGNATSYKVYGQHNVNLLKSSQSAVTLAVASWSGTAAPYTYSVTISGHDNTTDLVDLMMGDAMTADQLKAAQAANICKAEWASNTVLKLYAYGTKPEAALPIKIAVRKL